VRAKRENQALILKRAKKDVFIERCNPEKMMAFQNY
jgi:hypothetical protein